MKRITLLLLFIVVSFTAPLAQIQNKFLGATLGKSSQASVVSQLKAKTIAYSIEDNIVEIYATKLGTTVWDLINMEFTNGILEKITFSYVSAGKSNSTYLNTIDKLSNEITTKYADYLIKQDRVNKQWTFKDDNTLLLFQFQEVGGLVGLVLIYGDLELGSTHY